MPNESELPSRSALPERPPTDETVSPDQQEAQAATISIERLAKVQELLGKVSSEAPEMKQATE